jgi:hypothetical protein
MTIITVVRALHRGEHGPVATGDSVTNLIGFRIAADQREKFIIGRCTLRSSPRENIEGHRLDHE